MPTLRKKKWSHINNLTLYLNKRVKEGEKKKSPKLVEVGKYKDHSRSKWNRLERQKHINKTETLCFEKINKIKKKREYVNK